MSPQATSDPYTSSASTGAVSGCDNSNRGASNEKEDEDAGNVNHGTEYTCNTLSTPPHASAHEPIAAVGCGQKATHNAFMPPHALSMRVTTVSAKRPSPSCSRSVKSLSSTATLSPEEVVGATAGRVPEVASNPLSRSLSNAKRSSSSSSLSRASRSFISCSLNHVTSSSSVENVGASRNSAIKLASKQKQLRPKFYTKRDRTERGRARGS